MYCRRCGATLHQGVVICPECGARQRRGISSVRCARCGHRVSLGLTVCPHCGRDVHAAGPRWGLWLAGFAVVAVAALWGLGELPVDRITTEVASVRTRVERVVQFLGPVATATPDPARRATAQAVAALRSTPTVAPTEMPPTETPRVEARATVTPTLDTPTPEATAAFNSPALTPTPSPTLEPTATSTTAPTAEPTATPTAAPTQTLAPSGRVTYKVQSGDTLSSIAGKYGVTWQALADANKLTSRSTLRIGQELVIPVAGSQPAAPAPPPTAAPAGGSKYKVKSGDSLSGIAAKFGITWQELAAANGLTAQSRLNVGQELTIPGPGGVPQATFTPRPAPTATQPPPPTAIPLLSAPALVNPADQASYGGGKTEIYLIWQEKDAVPDGAGYRVLIQWTEQGQPMEYLVPVTTATSIRMPAWLFQRADQPTRKYTWSVRVVQPTTDGQGKEKDILLSPASESRVLYWY